MKNLLSFLFLVLASSCTVADNLHKVCPEVCYQWDFPWNGIGECFPGVPTCDENGDVIHCEGGDILPSQETCDGLDNDCSGLADDYIYPVHHWDFDPGRFGLDIYPCKFLGACFNSIAYCENTEWLCSYWNTDAELRDDRHDVVDQEERCDNIDGDCDGQVDEEVFDRYTLQERVCYSGNPVDSFANLPCRPGVLQCVTGEPQCLGEITPEWERCNSIDDDCDGWIDDGLEVAEGHLVGDFLDVFDTSGSMSGTIQAVKTAKDNYSVQFRDDPRYRFGIVDAAAQSGYVNLRQDLTDFGTYQVTLNNLSANGNGSESIPEAIWYVCDQNNPMGINWTPESARTLFVFTDEAAQIYQNTWLSEADIINACLETGTRVFIWSNNRPDFESLAVFSGGLHFDLINDPIVLENDMNSILLLSCVSE
jgi:hypothetical protein